MELISNRVVVEDLEFVHLFISKSNPGLAYSFDCSKSGEISGDGFVSREDRCLQFTTCLCDDTLKYLSIIARKFYRTEPATGRCSCGQIVALESFTNECQCGRMYNSFGQELSDPSSWGEETGEHPADILQIR